MNISKQTDSEQLVEVIRLQEQEIARLAKRLAKLTKEVALLKGATPEQMQQTLALLKQQLNDVRSAHFGRNSERRATKRRRKPRSKPRPDVKAPANAVQLSIELVELDADERSCTSCGLELKEIKGCVERSEVITRAKFVYEIVTVERQKYRCSKCESMHTAPTSKASTQPLKKGGSYSTDFAVEVAADKYVNHLPLERQVRQMRRDGLRNISSSTLFELCWTLSMMAVPTLSFIETLVFNEAVVFIDETRWPVLGCRGKPGSKNWQVWHFGNERGVFFRIPPTRSHTVVTDLVKEHQWSGTIMCDGYGAYDAVKSRTGVKLAGCWCHARRFFVPREGEFEEAEVVLDLMDELFLVERVIDEILATQSHENPSLDPLYFRAQMRQLYSVPLVRRIYQWASSTPSLKSIGLGPGLSYLTNQRAKLEVFLSDPRVPLSNLLAERNLRPSVVGRKNFYGARSQRGTLVAACFYTLRETAAIYGIDLRDYLRAIVIRHAKDPDAPVRPHEINGILER